MRNDARAAARDRTRLHWHAPGIQSKRDHAVCVYTVQRAEQQLERCLINALAWRARAPGGGASAPSPAGRCPRAERGPRAEPHPRAGRRVFISSGVTVSRWGLLPTYWLDGPELDWLEDTTAESS